MAELWPVGYRAWFRATGVVGLLAVLPGLYQASLATPEPEDRLAPAASGVAASSPPPVRVRMVGRLGGAAALTLVAEGAWRVVDAATRGVLAEGEGPGAWEIAVEGARVRAMPLERSGTPIAAATLRFESAVPDGRVRVASGRRRPEERSERFFLHLPGALEVGRGGRGLTVVNEAPLEAYIVGVVAAEGAASFHPEALKALAVAARSYTQRNRGRHGPDGDLCDTTHCQVYAGIGRAAPSVHAAVAATSGIFALYQGQPIDAVYSADCGGRTQNPEDAWGGRRSIPYLRSVLDAPAEGSTPYCAVNPRHTWRVALPLETLWHRLGWGGEVQHLWEAVVDATNGSGRATRITFAGGPAPPQRREEVSPEVDTENAKLLTPTSVPPLARQLTLAQFRALLRPHGLPGALFRLVVDRDRLVVEGAGRGHGVGLCQYGAQGMALQGHSYEEILRHYYTGIEVGPLRMVIGQDGS